MSLLSFFKSLNKQKVDFIFFPFKSALQPLIILLAIAFVINVNTFNNEMAYDDEIVIHKNEYVIQGVKGIMGILTHDSYYSYYKQIGLESNLPGGRYRPLSHISFAIEQEFIGTTKDGVVNENSWDVNQNYVRDPSEDTNKDGVHTDYDFWSKGSTFRHIVNVILYVFLICLIYQVLITYLFPYAGDMVFFACLLFAVHPLHTEVIANIKSRDEILSMIFIFLTLRVAFEYTRTSDNKNFILIFVYMFLALLSKEYALLLFILIPALFFIFMKDKFDFKDKNFWLLSLLTAFSAIVLVKFFNSGTLIAIPILFIYVGYYLIRKTQLPAARIIYALGVSLIAYLAIRFSATTHQVDNSANFQKDIIGNPYLFASVEQEWASKIAVWLKYIKLFFIPDPLIADYSFKSIPYSSFSSPEVWISIVLFASLIIAAIYFFFKRSHWAFGFIFLLLFFLPVANVLVDIGATMGERLFFHSSLGACIIFSMLIFKIAEFLKNKTSKLAWIIIILIGIQTVTYSALTIKRNPVWKNNKTLFMNDVKYVPNNLNVLAAAAVSCYEMAILPENIAKRTEYINKAIYYNNKGIAIYPEHFPFHLNKSIDFFIIEQLDSALASTDVVLKLAPTIPNVYRVRAKISEAFMQKGVQEFQSGKKKEGLQLLVKSIAANKSNEKAWNNMAKALFEFGAKDKALACYQSALKIDPKNQIAINGIKTIKESEK